MRAGRRGWLLALQQHEESAFISVRSKKHHENNKSKTNMIEHQETKTHPGRIAQGEDLERGWQAGYTDGEDGQSPLKSQS